MLVESVRAQFGGLHAETRGFGPADSGIAWALSVLPQQGFPGQDADPSRSGRRISSNARQEPRYTQSVKHRPIAILLTAIIALHALAGGAGGTAVLCLGGGHEHAPTESEHCESACGHDSSWPLPVPADEHEHDCECTDIELAVAELLNVPRGDNAGDSAPVAVPTKAWGVELVEAGLGQRGPPRPPPWLDPGGAHRLAIVASVRLTI